MIVSACIGLTVYGPLVLRWRSLESSERRELVVIGVVYGLVLLFFILCAWPAKDVAFAEERGSAATLRFLWSTTKLTFAEAFTGNWVTSLGVIALSAPFLWRGGGWLFFLLVSVILCLFGTVVYAAVWHFGILFLAWLFALWISTLRTRVTRPVIIALLSTIAFQCYWTVEAVRYDWNASYSGSLEAARYLHQDPPPAGGLYAIGYPTLALQPYFASNIYSDFNGHKPKAYWDWSKRNPARDASDLVSSRQPERVLVGYTSDLERARWFRMLSRLGYQQTRHFEGSTFWRTHIFQSQAYDVYRYTSTQTHAASTLNMADAASDAQLLAGFYDVEMNAWRWTAKNFSVVLKTPFGADQGGANLRVQLYVSPGQIQKLGPLTLNAEVNGFQLAPQTYPKSAQYTYSASVPSKVLTSDLALVNFRLDKVTKGVENDRRELGIVVSSVGLERED